MTRYSVQPSQSFAKNMCKNIGKNIIKNLKL